MKKTLFTFSLFLLIVLNSFGQITVNAVVKDKFENQPLPGAIIIEKGTKKGTQSDFDGNFSITVKNNESILVVSYLGFKTKEIKVSKIENNTIELKTDCTIDWFDSYKIGLFAKSGIINNPIGGEFKISSPIIFGLTPIVANIGYQTDLDKNRFFNAQISLLHLFVDCRFDADFNAYYFNIDSEDISTKEYKAETSLNFRPLSLIIGYSNLEINKESNSGYINKSGIILGGGYFIGKPFFMETRANVNIYKNLITYQAQLKKQYKWIYGFVKYHNVDSFNEISIGIGTEFGYYPKRKNNE